MLKINEVVHLLDDSEEYIIVDEDMNMLIDSEDFDDCAFFDIINCEVISFWSTFDTEVKHLDYKDQISLSSHIVFVIKKERRHV